MKVIINEERKTKAEMVKDLQSRCKLDYEKKIKREAIDDVLKEISSRYGKDSYSTYTYWQSVSKAFEVTTSISTTVNYGEPGQCSLSIRHCTVTNTLTIDEKYA